MAPGHGSMAILHATTKHRPRAALILSDIHPAGPICLGQQMISHIEMRAASAARSASTLNSAWSQCPTARAGRRGSHAANATSAIWCRSTVRCGVCFVNLGDSYASSVNGTSAAQTKANGNDDRTFRDKPFSTVGHGLKPKDMCGIPWRVALALQADGWWLRSDIIWSKSNPMPESVTDRPTKSHEYVFLLAKSARYFWDAEAVKEPTIWANDPRAGNGRHTYDGKRDGTDGQGQEAFVSIDPSGRNLRTVWSIPTQPYSGAHYATFPEALVERCVLAGSKPGSRVFDPFCGSGTTIQVARRLGRQGYGLDLSRVYLEENALPRALGKNTAAALATLPLFGGTEQADEPPKQDQLGKRTYTGFNARWKEQESRP